MTQQCQNSTGVFSMFQISESMRHRQSKTNMLTLRKRIVYKI